MKKFYLTMILGLSLCAVLAIAAPKVVSPEKIATPAKVAPATVNDLAGKYTFAYNDNGVNIEQEVEIEVSDQSANKVSVKGMFRDYTITATYNPETGELSFPYQVLGQSSANAEDIVFVSFKPEEDNTQEVFPSKDPVVFHYSEDDPFFFVTDDYFGVTGETAGVFSDGNYIVAHKGSLTKIPAEEVHPISIADAINLGNANQEGKEAVIDVTGAKVTFVDEDSNMAFMENKGGAISVQSEETLFTRGTELTGNISGMVYPGQRVMAEKADVTTTAADVTYGTEMTVGQASKPSNNYRLSTINIDENVTVAKGNNSINLTCDEYTIDVVDQWELDLDFDDTNLESVTGILIYDDGVMGPNDEPTPEGHMLLCPRYQSDIRLINPLTIGDIKHLEIMKSDYVGFTDAKVTFVNKDIAFIEDNTGAVQLKIDGEFAFERGDAIEGQIFGTWNGTTFNVILKKSDIKVTGRANVKYGKPLQFVNDMAMYVDYLVTIEPSEATPFTWNAELEKLQIGTDSKVFCYDYFQTLSRSYDWANKTYKQITGIVIKVGNDYCVAPRDADDIDASTGINALGAENEFKAYSIDGMAQPATSADQLRQGLYIINGKKVIIKK